MVKTTEIQGRRIYYIDKEVMESYGYEVNVKPDYFAQMMETWKEGEKKDRLSADELNTLKNKYNSDTMTKKECVDLMGELVEAGIMSKSEAHQIYRGGIPIDLDNMNGTLQKCTPEFEAAKARWYKAAGRTGNAAGSEPKMGYEYFEAWYDWARLNTSMSDSDSASYFVDTKRYIEILKELRK